MFKVVVAMEEIGTFESFGEAFKVFFEKVKEFIAKEGATYRVLETACWIKYEEVPMYVYDARDLAYKVGILQGKGQLTEPLPEVDADVVRLAFAEKALEIVEEYEDEAFKVLQQLTDQLSS